MAASLQYRDAASVLLSEKRIALDYIVFSDRFAKNTVGFASKHRRKPMVDYLSLPIGPRSPDQVNAVVEIPQGSVQKYEYDKQLRIFRLDRTLYSPVHYPGDYGFVPSTLGQDGDPLDILVLVDAPSFPGCFMEVRPIGMLRMVDQGKHDEKILAVVENDPGYRQVHDCSHVFPHILREIEHFFSIYKNLEGKQTKIAGWAGADAARKLIAEAQKAFGR